MEGGAIDYQELLLGVEQSKQAPQDADLSTFHVPLTIPDNVDVTQLRHDEEVHRMLYSIKLASLVVAQCLFVEDHQPIPELFYVTSERQRNVFNTQNPATKWHI